MPRLPVLSLRNVGVRYGSTVALQDFQLDLFPREIVGLLGPNGSGKSTTLGVAAGLLDPHEGSTTACGIARTANPCGYAGKIGFVPQEPALYDDLSARANLKFFGRLFGLRGYDLNCKIAFALERAKLTDRADDRVGTFSGGMKQRVNLACALIHDPPILLLDEPTAALDAKSRDLLFGDLHRLRESGHAILLTTHHLDEAEGGCDRLIVLERGRTALSGTTSELIRRAPGGRAVLYGQLREPLEGFFLQSLKARLDPNVEIEATGRRLRLSAESHQSLGQALAIVLSDGIVVETFRTPPGRLESLMREPATRVEEPSCSAP
jgi:ABC-2 type transport system ATP-binding protein